MPIQGLRDTTNFVANERPENWRQGIMLLYPNSARAAKAPLTALTSLMKEKSTDDPRFHWWEKELDDRRLEIDNDVVLAAPAAGTIETIPLRANSNAITFVKGDLLYSEQTTEIMRVHSDPTSNTSITVVRGVAGSATAALDANGAGINPNLLCIGSAFEEGSLPPTGISYDPTEFFNYTQIFRKTFEITGTAAQTRLRTVDAITEAKRECLEYIGVDMERAFLLGRRFEGVLNGRPWRTTAGVINQIDANNIYAFDGDGTDPGVVRMVELEERMLELFRFGSYEKLALCGNRALLAIQQVVRRNTTSNWTASEPVKEFGMEVVKLTTPFGVLTLKGHPLMTQTMGGINNEGAGTQFFAMDSWLLALDMDDVEYRYMEERDLDYESDLQANGLDGMQSGYMGECGIMLAHGKNHALWTQMFRGEIDTFT